MRKFIIKVLGFGFAVLLMAVMLDVMISFGLRKTDCYRYQTFSDIFKGNMNCDVLYIGNSRGFSHFNPRIIDSICRVNSYSLGLGGYPINAQIATYHCYKTHNGTPRLIVQQVDFVTLNIMQDIRHQHDSERFFPTVYDPFMRKELKNMGYGFMELYCPIYRYFGYQKVIKDGLLEFLKVKHYIERPAYKGFSPEKGKWDGTNVAAMDSITSDLDKEAITLFENYLDECKKDGVYVLLVNSPVYAPTTKKVKNMDEVNNYFENVANRFGYKYLNYTENYDLCNDTLNFCVSVHLNPKATDKFSTDFAHDLDSLGLLK
ncbi:MAG: hypothetical protein IKN08_08120 [Bacteroidales bacterium]|nr:hypothetical protein [Bacteroidales bacterium]MBR6929636.1 hypothetical protein [Bacteroidales bacterium]